jgi:uncharacterized protein (TIGR00255 family)
MIRSMTGFGAAETELLGQKLSVELQSVNHRYCEISIRLPRSLSAFELPLRALLQRHFTRGKIHFQALWEGHEDPARRVALDRDRLRAVLADIRSVAKELGLSGQPDLGTLLALPDLWVQDAAGLDEDVAWKGLEGTAERAVRDLFAMREREGRELAKELEGRLGRLEALVAQAEKKNAGRPEAIRDRLRERIRALLEGVGEVDPARVVQEAALLAERADFTEECVRLRAHIAQFRALMGDPEPAGRKLNFLLQEMNREANTTGSKANDAELAAIVIEMKDELEKLREQILNVE